jgi:N-acetylneuraminate synthase
MTSPWHTDKPGPYFIAEIGVNHEANIDLAHKLITEAIEGGADAVKFQVYKADKLTRKDAPAYWDTNEEPTKTQHELFKKYDGFEKEDYEALARHAEYKGIDFCATPYDLDCIEWLAPLVKFWKIASADITNHPLIEACVNTRLPMLISTGGATDYEIDSVIVRSPDRRGTLSPFPEHRFLHCVLEYPTRIEHANLRAIENLGGYSCHVPYSLPVLLAAWMNGAQIIEKHFTLESMGKGNDHYHALDREQLAEFRAACDVIERAQGTGEKKVWPWEEEARKAARRSLVLKRDVKKGELLKREDLIALRPGDGIPPSKLW